MPLPASRCFFIPVLPPKPVAPTPQGRTISAALRGRMRGDPAATSSDPSYEPLSWIPSPELTVLGSRLSGFGSHDANCGKRNPRRTAAAARHLRRCGERGHLRHIGRRGGAAPGEAPVESHGRRVGVWDWNNARCLGLAYESIPWGGLIQRSMHTIHGVSGKGNH